MVKYKTDRLYEKSIGLFRTPVRLAHCNLIHSPTWDKLDDLEAQKREARAASEDYIKLTKEFSDIFPSRPRVRTTQGTGTQNRPIGRIFFDKVKSADKFIREIIEKAKESGYELGVGTFSIRPEPGKNVRISYVDEGLTRGMTYNEFFERLEKDLPELASTKGESLNPEHIILFGQNPKNSRKLRIYFGTDTMSDFGLTGGLKDIITELLGNLNKDLGVILR